jgi:hypothetical protein
MPAGAASIGHAVEAGVGRWFPEGRAVRSGRLGFVFALEWYV